MSTVKKIALPVVVVLGSGFILLLFLWNDFLSERHRTMYLDGQSVSGIAFDPSGQAWLSMCHVEYDRSVGVYKYAGDIGTFKDGTFTSRASGLDLSDGCLNNPSFDQQGRLWGTIYSSKMKGVLVYDKDKWKLYAEGDDGFVGSYFSAFAIGPDGKVWLGVVQGGLSIFDGQKWTSYTTSNSQLTDDDVSDIAFGRDGKAWIATQGGGINIFDGREWSSMTSSNSGLPWDIVSTIAFDPQGKLWVSTNADTYFYDGTNWTTYNMIKEGLSSSVVDHFAFDGRGRVWAANNLGSGSYALIYDGKKWVRYQADFSRAYQSGQMVSDSKGNIWLGSSNDRGFTIISPEYNPPAGLLKDIKLFLSTGGISFLFILLIGVCLAIAFDAYIGIGIGMGVGLIILMIASLFRSEPSNLYLFPGTGIAILGMMGGFLGGVFGRSKPVRNQIIGAFAGLTPAIVVTCCAIAILIFMAK